MKRKIAHFYKESQSSWLTINKFNISYKDLYKVIETSKILSFKTVWDIQYKRCSTCQTFKPFTLNYYYQRAWTKYFYSSCKICMNRMSKNYKIIHKRKRIDKQRQWSKDYYYNNKNTILSKRSLYYKKHKTKILKHKQKHYIKKKLQFIRNFITNIK